MKAPRKVGATRAPRLPVSASGLAKAGSAGVVPLSCDVRLTKWRAPNPTTKHLRLADDGSVEKRSTAAQLYDGQITRIACKPAGFVNVLKNIGPNECLSYGIPKDDEVTRILSRVRFHANDAPGDAMTRTNDKMTWPEGPAILMIDYDPNGNALPQKDLLDALYVACPSLKNSAHVWAASASSCLLHLTTKRVVRGVEGQRVYVVVADGTDIPRAGAVLAKRAWLHGHGFIKISKSGTALVRGLVDEAVFQPTRIDFCAPAVCDPPLSQNKPLPQHLGNKNYALDTRFALPDLSAAEESQYQSLVKAAKAAKADEITTVKAAYRACLVQKYVARGLPQDDAVRVVSRALDADVLCGEFLLTAEDGRSVTVGDLLRDREHWHGARFADPMEPEYNNDRRIARANLLGTSQPSMFSFAHGGRRYSLESRDQTVRIVSGARHEYLTEIVSILRDREIFFERAGAIVSVDQNGRLYKIGANQVRAAIDRVIRLEHFKRDQWRSTDAALDLAKILCEAHADKLMPLDAVLTAPCLDPITGRLVTTSGYDCGLKIMFSLPVDVVPVPERPNGKQVRNALQALWAPVRLFPFAGPIDQSVMLAAILTAVVRMVLPTAPAFAFDAPIQASGKSLLAKVLAAIAGVLAAMSPQPGRGGDDELRKRLFGHLLGGDAAIVIDNIVGEFDSASLAALLTSETYSDRVLGESRTEVVSSRALVLLTGNNMMLRGDLPRRVLKCRIDPATGSPHQRHFDFDPETVVQESRQELVSAALTLIRGYMSSQSDTRPGVGRTASFDIWDDVVRQTICWLVKLQAIGKLDKGVAENGDSFPVLVDPMDAINAAVNADIAVSPHGRLLEAWSAEVGTGPGRDTSVTVAKLIDLANIRPSATALPGHSTASKAGRNPPTGSGQTVASIKRADAAPTLLDVLTELAGERGGPVNSRSLGKKLSAYKDRIVDGKCLRQGSPYQGACTWWVERLGGEGGESGEVDSADFRTNKKPVKLPKKARNKPTTLTTTTTASASGQRPGRRGAGTVTTMRAKPVPRPSASRNVKRSAGHRR